MFPNSDQRMFVRLPATEAASVRRQGCPEFRIVVDVTRRRRLGNPIDVTPRQRDGVCRRRLGNLIDIAPRQRDGFFGERLDEGRVLQLNP